MAIPARYRWLWRAAGIGFVAGSAAFLLGVLATRVVYWAGPPILVFPGMGIGATRLSTWLYLNAHTVTLTAAHSIADQLLGAGSGYELLTRDGSPLYRSVFVLPPLVLTAAGVITGTVAAPYRSTWRRIAVGSLVVAGYLPTAVAAALLSTVTDPAILPATRIGPALAEAILYAGLAFPVAFGALGGGLAAVTHVVSRRWRCVDPGSR